MFIIEKNTRLVFHVTQFGMKVASRDWGHIGIKKRTNHVRFHWKACLFGFQKIIVNGSKNVFCESYCTPKWGSLFSRGTLYKVSSKAFQI